MEEEEEEESSISRRRRTSAVAASLKPPGIGRGVAGEGGSSARVSGGSENEERRVALITRLRLRVAPSPAPELEGIIVRRSLGEISKSRDR